ncbi:hypothetical protein N7454_009284 [Penicillium verhagenii]|nr:hypothetical protein N7454_009284 [Penicillium verhagenii]
MTLKLIFQVGASLPGSLDWDHDELFNAPAMAPFYDADTHTEHQHISGPRFYKMESPSALCRRKLWMTTMPFIGDQRTQAFFASDGDDTTLSQFYDQSFAFHEAPSNPSASEVPEDLTQELDSIETDDSTSKGLYQLPPFRINGPLRDLQDIPTAEHLQSIVPQTMSVNLVVGVIAVQSPRRVVTRQWKKELDIIELVVGDETKAGTLLLLRTVGLGSFRDQVYGQSLRGGMTQVDLLHRPTTDAGGLNKVLPTSVQGDLPQKVHKVREWILQFVGTDGVGGTSLPGMPETERGHRLPPDTQ